MAKTSNKISSLAGRYAGIQSKDLTMMTALEALERAKEIRSLAASCLRQDEVKGFRGLVRKVLG